MNTSPESYATTAGTRSWLRALAALSVLGLTACGILWRESPGPTTPTRQQPASDAAFQPISGDRYGWKCAREHGECTFAGTATVLYGADTRIVERQARDGVACSNGVFGDPAPGIVKTCYVAYRELRGSCRGDGWDGGGWPRAQGMLTSAECAERCARTRGCSAFDIARPQGERYDCFLFGHADVRGNGNTDRCYVRGGGVTAPPPPPPPVRDPARAAQLNAEGKDLWLEQKDLAGAVVKFRAATGLDPLGSYFFNLCYAEHQLGHFAEAKAACEQVAPNSDDPKLEQKAKLVLDDIAKRAPQP